MENIELSKIIVINVLLILLWNIFIFLICKNIKTSFFDPQKYTYKEKVFERGGKFYSEKLKIKIWKDFLPQYISKNGFSKKNFQNKNLVYIDRFILETCRAEWNHRMCMLIALPGLIFNTFKTGIFLTALILLTNLPFVFIQRYNRFRLLALKRHKLKKYSYIQTRKDSSKFEHSLV